MDFVTDSAEDLCATMYDNKVPRECPGWWIFTFGRGQEHAGYIVKIKGTRNSSRKKMFEKYGISGPSNIHLRNGENGLEESHHIFPKSRYWR